MRGINNLLGIGVALLMAACANDFPAPLPGSGSASACNCDAGTFCSPSCCPMNCTESLVASIDHARTSVQIATATGMAQPVAAALANARQRGVAIDMVLDASQAPLAGAFATRGIHVKVHDGSSFGGMLIVDGAQPEAANAALSASRSLHASVTPRQRIDNAQKFQSLWEESK